VPNEKRFLYLALPFFSPHFLLLLLMLWDGTEIGSQEPKREKKTRLENRKSETQVIDVYGQSVTITLQLCGFSLCLLILIGSLHFSLSCHTHAQRNATGFGSGQSEYPGSLIYSWAISLTALNFRFLIF
jgi:hypothetical protein